MMAHSDVFLTVYSTMVVEAAVHERPIVTCAWILLEAGTGRKFSPLTKIGEWPTHSRFRQAKAGKVAYDEAGLKEAVDFYLQNPNADLEACRAFIRQECTFTDGNAGKRSGDFLLSLVS
jgi:CDP-glycerol glycerophosphotransferase (TagB/SpsB family)